jgi:PAS domain S-box-containing protein
LPQLDQNSKNLWSCIHPEDADFVRKSYQKTTTKCGIQNIKYRICPINQAPVWVNDVFELRTNGSLYGVLKADSPQENHYQELKERAQAIKEVVTYSAHKTGQTYFNQMVQSLCKVIKADFVIIGKEIPQKNAVETIAMGNAQQLFPNFYYALQNTPCSNVVGQTTCVYPQGVATLFPEDKMLKKMGIEGYLGTPIFDAQGKSLGIIIALFKKPIQQISYAPPLFELFATHISAEFNRITSEAKLSESEQRFKKYFKEDKAIKLLINPVTEQIEDANQAAEQFYGYTYEELTQLKISAINTLPKTEISKKIAQAQQHQVNFFRFRHRTKQGSIKHVNVYSTPLQVNDTAYLLSTIHDVTESVQNKQELIKEKQFIDSIVQYAAEGVVVCQQTKYPPYIKFTIWNHQMEKITGYTLKEINRLGWYQAISASDANTQVDGSYRIAKLLQGDNLVNESWEIQHKNGQRKNVSISTNIIRQNAKVYIMAIMQDITEQKQAQRSLMTRQAYMQLLYEITSNASDEIDQQLQNALKLTTEFFGAETGLVSSITNDVFTIVNSYDVQQKELNGTTMALTDTLCKATIAQNDVLMIANTQEEKWAHIVPKNTKVRSYIGTVIHVFGKQYGSLCITSKQARLGYPAVAGEFINLLARWIGNLIEKQIKEKDLRESEERYRSLTESAPVGIVLHNQGKIIYTNPFGKQILEATHHDQVIGLPIGQILHPDSRQVAFQRVKELYQKKGNYAPPLEEKIITLKNNVKYCLISGIAIEYKGQPTICNVFADISDRKAVEKELIRKKNQVEKVNKELEELTYVASHDLKAPLANLQGLMMLIDELKGVKDNSLDIFERMQHSVVRMQNTLNNLNEVIALKQEATLPKENIQFEELYANIIASLETQIKEAQANIQADFSAAPTIAYPLFHIKSIMQNLLTNAIKYRDVERPLSIEVRTTMHNSQVCLMVKDNGLGIDLSKSKDKLFGLFKRLHVHVEGEGIGLYILKSIVESHRGFIEVSSKLNQGTTFKIYLGNE